MAETPDTSSRIFRRSVALASQAWWLFVVVGLVCGIGAFYVSSKGGSSRHTIDVYVARPTVPDVEIPVDSVVRAVDTSQIATDLDPSFTTSDDESARTLRVTAIAKSAGSAEQAAMAYLDAFNTRYREMLTVTLAPQRTAEQALIESIDADLADLVALADDPVGAVQIATLLSQQSQARSNVAFIDAYSAEDAVDPAVVTRTRSGGSVAVGNRLAVALAGAIAGLAVLMLVIIGRAIVDRRVHDQHDVEDVAGSRTVIGTYAGAADVVGEQVVATALRKQMESEQWSNLGLLPLRHTPPDLTTRFAERVGGEIAAVPPLATSAEAVERASAFDAWVVLVPIGRATMDELRTSLDALLRAGGTVAGILLVRSPKRLGSAPTA